MTANRRKGGRTTPKGTTNPSRSGPSKPARPPGAKPDTRLAASKNADKFNQRVSRPETHNRGNR